MKRTFAGLMCLLLITGLLYACSSDKAADNENGAAEGQNAGAAVDSGVQGGKLRVIGAHSELDPAIEIFKKTHPDAEVEVIEGTWTSSTQNAKQKQLVLISSGEQVDIGKMVWGKEFFSKGILEDLTDEVQGWPFYNNLTQAQKDRMSHNGRIFGVTNSTNTVVMFYNKDILGQIGMEPPKTYDDMVAIAKKIKEADLKNASGKPVYATSFEGGNWFTDYWLWMLGGKQMNEDYTKTLIDSPESIQAFAKMQEFVKNGWAPKIDGSFNQAFLNGQIAFWPDGLWDLKPTKDAGVNFGVAVLPAGPGGSRDVSIGGIEYAVFKASKNKELAIEFLKVLSSKEYQLKLNYVTEPAMYDDPEKQEIWKKDGDLEAWMVQKEQLQHTKFNFLENPFIFPDAAKIYGDALQKLLVRLDEPEALMKEAAQEINKGIEADK